MAAMASTHSSSIKPRPRRSGATCEASVAPDRKLLPDLAAEIAALRARDIDAATIDVVKLHGFDALGATCAGAATSEIVATREALLRAAFLTPPKSILDH